VAAQSSVDLRQIELNKSNYAFTPVTGASGRPSGESADTRYDAWKLVAFIIQRARDADWPRSTLRINSATWKVTGQTAACVRRGFSNRQQTDGRAGGLTV